MLAKMIDRIVSLKQAQTFDIGGEHYTDGNLTRIPPHVDRPRSISMSGLDSICKLIRTEREKVGATIMVQVSSYKQVEARQGVDLKAMVAVKPRVKLIPFRTFLEVPQPESEFLLRVDKDKGVGFFEADGGIWKLEAKSNIAKYFEAHLKDLVDAGNVVVMQ